mmetsp:Transcript_14419/g.34904  ORF Transcript_14419/g.34904 Transcript_14419/m.34904 type:complete len:318 (-) Transcript_14419:265-1218(-)
MPFAFQRRVLASTLLHRHVGILVTPTPAAQHTHHLAHAQRRGYSSVAVLRDTEIYSNDIRSIVKAFHMPVSTWALPKDIRMAQSWSIRHDVLHVVWPDGSEQSLEGTLRDYDFRSVDYIQWRRRQAHGMPFTFNSKLGWALRQDDSLKSDRDVPIGMPRSSQAHPVDPESARFAGLMEEERKRHYDICVLNVNGPELFDEGRAKDLVDCIYDNSDEGTTTGTDKNVHSIIDAFYRFEFVYAVDVDVDNFADWDINKYNELFVQAPDGSCKEFSYTSGPDTQFYHPDDVTAPAPPFPAFVKWQSSSMSPAEVAAYHGT